jgi:hypothetical protein
MASATSIAPPSSIRAAGSSQSRVTAAACEDARAPRTTKERAWPRPITSRPYDVDITGWGWIHLIVGIVVAAGGVGLLYRKLWAAALAIALAVLSAIVNFFFIPYYPFWSILIIALNVFVIWAITRPGAIED